MERISIQMRASQVTLRHTILALLTPVQRATVATVIGELAIAPDPDLVAGAGRIDAALSPAQRQAVLESISAEAVQRERLFAEMVAQSQTILSSQRDGGGGAHLQQLSPQSPASGAVQVESGASFAMPGPAMVREMAPNETAGAGLIGILISPSWMGGPPVPAIIRTGPASRGAQR